MVMGTNVCRVGVNSAGTGWDGRSICVSMELYSMFVCVCSVQEMASIYPDRVVAIRGPTVDSMSDAEAALSAKLRECHQRDYASMTRVHNAAFSTILPFDSHSTAIRPRYQGRRSWGGWG